MCSDGVLLSVKNVGKCYEMYDKPFHRLWQTLTRGKRLFYKEFWALRDISFEVKRGECVGIIGCNGSGKSTLLQLIAGTLSPTTGSINFTGRAAALLELGSGFNPEFTGRENVYMNAAVLGMTRQQIDEKFDDIASFADIGDFIEQPVKIYSSGMTVRLAFAIQAQLESDLLIIDEALAVGDNLFQKRCYERINSLKESGVSILFVSHEQETVRTMTDRAIFLDSGKVVSMGLPAEIILEYRKFLNNIEMQKFDLKAHEQENSDEQSNCPAETTASEANVTNDKSFGTGQAEITSVEVLNKDMEACNYFLPLEKITIKVTFCPKETSDQLNVALRIRNKSGVKIYSWGTLNQDISLAKAASDNGSLFRSKVFNAGVEYSVYFHFANVLGCDYYEVQACISHEPKGDYSEQLIHHWVDEAASFRTGHDHHGYWFGGVSDLQMKAVWENVDELR